jgi:hypothetical protein
VPITFLAWLETPLSFRTLGTEAARIAEDLLRQPPGSIEPRLYELRYPVVSALPSLSPELEASVIDLLNEPDAEAEALLTYYGPLDGTPVRVHLGGVFADNLRTCASMFAAMTVVLATVRLNGGGQRVFDAWEYCPKWEPDKDDNGQPLDEVLDCLRLPAADRTMADAIRELMERTSYPCSGFVNSDIPVKQ